VAKRGPDSLPPTFGGESHDKVTRWKSIHGVLLQKYNKLYSTETDSFY